MGVNQVISIKQGKRKISIASVARAVFSRQPADGAKHLQPITENSPGVKLRRAEELYQKATRS